MSSSTEATSKSQGSITRTSSTTRLELVVPTATVSVDPDPAPIPAVEHVGAVITAADLLAHGLSMTSTSSTNAPELSISPGISRHLENYSPPRYNGHDMPFVEVEVIPSDCPPPIPVEVITPYDAAKDPPKELSEEIYFDMPQWFLDNCVMTAEQLRKKEVNLLSRSDEGDDHLVSKESETYEVESFVYEPLQAIHIPENERTETGDHAFKFDAVYLRYPVKVSTIYYPVRHAAPVDPPPPPVPDGTNAFLSVLVEQFAKDCSADMITLTLVDLRDLVAEFARSQGVIYAGSSIDYGLVKTYVNHISSNSAVLPLPCVDPDGFPMHWREETHIGPTFPWRSILSAPSQMSIHNEAEPVKRRTLVLHIPELQTLLSILGLRILDILKQEVKRFCERGYSIVVFLSSPEHTAPQIYTDSTALSTIGEKPMTRPVYVTPKKSAEQIALFTKHQKQEMSHLLSNIRGLQYAIRTRFDHKQKVCHLLPYASWDFLKPGSLEKSSLNAEDLEVLANRIGPRSDPQRIRSEIEAHERCQESQEHWWPAIQEQHDKMHSKAKLSKWASYPDHVQGVIRQFEEDPNSYALERGMLDFLVDPKDIEQGWADIEIEARVKNTIIQLVSQSFASVDQAYGILKRARISGALLYGPPGTGKTQLARVVARECNAAMLCVSGADIEHKYVGETEKAIQALFNLARMLYPSMIFIDEADSLFQSREMNLHEYSRSRINQLLAEMDGLVHHKHPPFILLATNYPRQLDHAVLRRVPSLLHLGLPSTPARGKIFEVYLRDEHLDDDVKTDSLASKTMGYSGSDIKTLCVQTALLCDTYINHKSRSVRLLKNTHFLQALNRCAPTVSRPALEEISAFAAMHDPRALESSADTETGNVCHDGIVGLSDVLRDEHFD